MTRFCAASNSIGWSTMSLQSSWRNPYLWIQMEPTRCCIASCRNPLELLDFVIGRVSQKTELGDVVSRVT